MCTYFGCAVNRDNFYFLILLFTSLHVSASIGHLQVKCTQSFLKTITPTTDLFLGYTVYIYIHIHIYIYTVCFLLCYVICYI
jgi:hypothetical protein